MSTGIAPDDPTPLWTLRLMHPKDRARAERALIESAPFPVMGPPTGLDFAIRTATAGGAEGRFERVDLQGVGPAGIVTVSSSAGGAEATRDGQPAPELGLEPVIDLESWFAPPVLAADD